MIDKKKHLSGGSYKVEALHTTRTTTTHSHNFFELVYVTDGSAIHTVEGTPAEISKGDYFIIEYGCSHAYSNCRNFGVINCLFVPEFIDATLKGCKSYSQLITNYLIRPTPPLMRFRKRRFSYWHLTACLGSHRLAQRSCLTFSLSPILWQATSFEQLLLHDRCFSCCFTSNRRALSSFGFHRPLRYYGPD